MKQLLKLDVIRLAIAITCTASLCGSNIEFGLLLGSRACAAQVDPKAPGDQAPDIPAQQPRVAPPAKPVAPPAAVAPENAAELADEAPSPRVQRVTALIERSIDLYSRQLGLEDRLLKATKSIEEKSQLQKELPNVYNGLAAETLLTQDRLARLSGALSLPPNNPQVQEYYRTKAYLATLVTKGTTIEQQITRLPLEIRDLNQEQIAVRADFNTLKKEMVDAFAAWSQVLSFLVALSPSESTAIVNTCDLRLVDYPQLHTLRAMRGLAKLQQSQYEASKEDLTVAFNEVSSTKDPFFQPFRLRYAACLAWNHLQLKEFDKAAAYVNQGRKIDGRDYELMIISAQGAFLQNRLKVAFGDFKTAAGLAPKVPHAYRMTAEMILAAPVSDKSTAVSYAEKACSVDELGDYRNSLVLAQAYHQTGNAEKWPEAMDKAIDQSPPHIHPLLKTEQIEMAGSFVPKDKLVDKN